MDERSDLSLNEQSQNKSMSRRQFLKVAGITGAAVGLGGGLSQLVTACGGETTTTTGGAATTSAPVTTANATTTAAAPTSTTAGAATTTSVSAAAAALKVGMICDFGWALEVGWQHQMEALIPDLNAKGGLSIGGQKYTIDLKIYDGKRDAETSRSAIQRLLSEDKVRFILGDDTVAYWQPLTEAAGVLVTAMTSVPTILKPPNKMTFQASYLNLLPAASWGWFSKTYPEIKTIAAAHPDSVGGKAESKQLANLSAFFGQEVVKDIFYPPDTKDFTAFATAVIDTKADVFNTGAGGTLADAMFYKALSQGGWKGKLCAYHTFSVGAASNIVPPASFEGLLCPIPATELPSGPTEVAKQLIDLYAAKQGKWDYPSVSFVSTWYLLKAALEAAGSTDPAKVADVIHGGLEFEAAFGRAKMVPRPDLGNQLACDAMFTPPIGLVKEGKFIVQHELSFDEAFEMNKLAWKW